MKGFDPIFRDFLEEIREDGGINTLHDCVAKDSVVPTGSVLVSSAPVATRKSTA
ncbi:MAG: hypothetical protein ACOCYW_09145 [Roseicyclus sp.]